MRVLLLALLALLLAAAPLPLGSASGCPLDFTATVGADQSVTFHWSGFGGATGYQVFGFQGQGDTAAYSPMLSGDARDATATNLANGSYVFWVDAFHDGSVVASSCEQSVSVGGGLSAACPTNVTASAGTLAVGLHWDAVANATGYRIARAAGDAAWDDDYATTATTSFVDTNVTAGSTYHYRVISENTREPAEACVEVSATVPGAASVPFFPGPASLALGVVGSAGAVAIVLLTRSRRA